MKIRNFTLNRILFLVLFVLIGCVSEEDQKLPEWNPVIFQQDFQVTEDEVFLFEGWTNISTQGSVIWKHSSHRGNGYCEFSPFNSGEAINEAWLISTPIDISKANAKKMVFESAQHHVVHKENNHLKVLISTDFKGNITQANWKELDFIQPSEGVENNYVFVKSGQVDLSDYNGIIYIAFKANGGTNQPNSGAYMIDNIRIF